jgi:hypothetical protein
MDFESHKIYTVKSKIKKMNFSNLRVSDRYSTLNQ